MFPVTFLSPLVCDGVEARAGSAPADLAVENERQIRSKQRETRRIGASKHILRNLGKSKEEKEEEEEQEQEQEKEKE